MSDEKKEMKKAQNSKQVVEKKGAKEDDQQKVWESHKELVVDDDPIGRDGGCYSSFCTSYAHHESQEVVDSLKTSSYDQEDDQGACRKAC